MIDFNDAFATASQQRCAQIEREELSRAYAKTESLRTSEWAAKYFYLSPEDNDRRLEKYDPTLTPWHAPIMDALGDLRVRRVVAMLPAQVGGKTTIMKADLGARIHMRPSPILWGIPRDKDVRTWSKERVDPMLRDCNILKGLVSDDTRDKRNTIAYKSYAGGFLAIVGMTQPADVQARPVGIIRIDELDRAPRTAGKEGSPLAHLKTRMKAFYYRNIGLFGTPTNTNDSPIVDEFNTTNQSRWMVPCPHCGKHQVLMMGSPDVKWGLKWDKDSPETTVHYVCEWCLQAIDERHKRAMNALGEFVPDRPEITEDLGFWMNALVGMFDGSRWGLLVRQFLESKADSPKLKQFVNTVLCEPYEDRTTKLQVGTLIGRSEKYDAQVPHGVGVLIRSVDTQDDRLEMAVWGFGANRETWPIDYEYIPGDPSTPVPWRALDQIRAERRYIHASGRPLRPALCFIDHLGHNSEHAKAWAKKHGSDAEPAFAISGDGRETHPIVGKPQFDKHRRVTLFRVGTWPAKVDILKRLNEVVLPEGALKPLHPELGIESKYHWADPMFRLAGYIHIPDEDWFTAEQLKQLSDGERLDESRVRGRLVKYWTVLGPNHFLDLAVYGLAGLYRLGTKVVYEQLGAMADALSAPYDAGASAMKPPQSGRRMLSTGVQVV